ncbi:helix-turn-helix domain-containing protein, partial [Klebsiella pneumoniae]|uniref:helix-turn-helix domain-containing protein n=1 Tax=Klebsiella pneumoniae TaxID=573 RepID=UPI001C30EE1B
EWVHVQLHQQKGMISLSPPTICNSARRLYVEEKMGATAISRQLGIGRASVYRVLDRDEQPA